MLLEFLVSNFRSFDVEQKLSLVAVKKDNTLEDSNLVSLASGEKVLCGSAISGPNAAGKSNLVRAMRVMRAIILESATNIQAGQKLNIQPFAFSPKNKNQPTEFEISVQIADIRYQYGFSLLPDRIWDEWLYVYETPRKAQKWFHRIWDEPSQKYKYKFSVSFKGHKEVWKQATRENALFFSTAIQLNSEQLKPLWDWLSQNWMILTTESVLSMDLSLDIIEKDGKKAEIIEFLNAADLGIKDINITKQRVKQAAYSMEVATGKIQSTEVTDIILRIPQFKHSGIEEDATFVIQDESEGTQKWFVLSGFVLTVLKRGMTLVVDELERSMHPLLTRYLIQLFFSKKINPHGAQLIFTTHNTSLLDATLLRRDQIWFIERDMNHASQLIPLTEFSARKKEAFEKGYLEGRYGAIPILSFLKLETPENA